MGRKVNGLSSLFLCSSSLLPLTAGRRSPEHSGAPCPPPLGRPPRRPHPLPSSPRSLSWRRRPAHCPPTWSPRVPRTERPQCCSSTRTRCCTSARTAALRTPSWPPCCPHAGLPSRCPPWTWIWTSRMSESPVSAAPRCNRHLHPCPCLGHAPPPPRPPFRTQVYDASRQGCTPQPHGDGHLSSGLC